MTRMGVLFSGTHRVRPEPTFISNRPAVFRFNGKKITAQIEITNEALRRPLQPQEIMALKANDLGCLRKVLSGHTADQVLSAKHNQRLKLVIAAGTALRSFDFCSGRSAPKNGQKGLSYVLLKLY